MRRAAGHILRALFMTGMLICLGRAFSQYAELEHMDSLVHYLPVKPRTGEEIERLEEELEKDGTGRLEAAAWTLGKDARFSAPDAQTEAKGSLILLKGQSGLLYSNAKRLGPENENGLLLTEDAAYALFGDTDAEGRKIVYEAENKEYTVLGLIPGDEILFLIQAPRSQKEGEEPLSFEQLGVLVYETGETDRLQALKEFEEKAGITENDRRSDFDYYKNGGAFLISVLPALVFLMIAGMGIRALLRDSRKPFRVLAYLLALAGTVLVFRFGSAAHVSLPESWIPAMWSDFSFWGEKISESIRVFKGVLFTQKGFVEIEYYNRMLAILIDVLGGTLCWFGSVINLRFREKSEWFFYELMALGLTAAVLYLMRQQGALLPGGWVWLALYPLYFPALELFGKNEITEIKE